MGVSNGGLLDVGEVHFMVPDQDDAQAVLQPAMSAAASHLTSARTPAVEKAAALQRFDGEDGDDGSGHDEQGHGHDSQEDDPHGHPFVYPAPRRRTAKTARANETRGVLGAALGSSATTTTTTTRQRSRSAGQEALKKLQQAFPSLSSPTHLLPSLPRSLLSSFTDGKRQSREQAQSRTLPLKNGLASSSSSSSSAAAAARPPMLRRVTSDDGMLYHTLSRASSLGDDDRFVDVREMVNIRLMAIKDSLPDVPNFRMPSLARLQAASRRSTMSLNGIFSSEQQQQQQQQPANNMDRGEPGTAARDTSAAAALDRVLAQLTGDIVIMGGYRGSVLRSAEPPHQQLWAPVKIGLNMRKVNLEVGLDDADEATMEERVIASGMLQHIGPIDISRRLFKKLRACDNARAGRLRVWDYGYDWRLSPARLSRGLQDFLRTLPSNQPGVAPEARGALVVAHSLGGLLTRHAVNQRPDLFSGVLYAGVPQRCINILGPLRNGDAVLFNDKLLTAQVNFSIRTSFALLPDDGFCFVDRATGEPYPVDFFDAASWVRWHLSPCVAPLVPPPSRPPPHSPLSSLFPNSLLPRPRGDSSRSERPSSPPSPTIAVDPEERQRRNLEYLARTLASVRQFRSQLAHCAGHQSANAYPPLAVVYSKAIPTVYAARVSGRDAIARSDAYDDLVFRPGDGVVLAKEAMLPDGYALVRGGRVSTERGHITMLGDMPAIGRALEALLRGRRKGIGLGVVAAGGQQ